LIENENPHPLLWTAWQPDACWSGESRQSQICTVHPLVYMAGPIESRTTPDGDTITWSRLAEVQRAIRAAILVRRVTVAWWWLPPTEEDLIIMKQLCCVREGEKIWPASKEMDHTATEAAAANRGS
jgi:hypothetical protein